MKFGNKRQACKSSVFRANMDRHLPAENAVSRYILMNLPTVLDVIKSGGVAQMQRLPPGFLQDVQSYLRATYGIAKSYAKVKSDVHRQLKKIPAEIIDLPVYSQLQFAKACLTDNQQVCISMKKYRSGSVHAVSTETLASHLSSNIDAEPVDSSGLKGLPVNLHMSQATDPPPHAQIVELLRDPVQVLFENFRFEDLGVSSQVLSTACNSKDSTEIVNRHLSSSLFNGDKIEAQTFNSVFDKWNRDNLLRDTKPYDIWQMENNKDHDPVLSGSVYEGLIDSHFDINDRPLVTLPSIALATILI